MSGGSEATEAAMKLARQYHKQTGSPRKYKIVSRYGAYHGGTMGALSAGGGRERKSVFEPLGVGFIHVHPPYCYRCPFDQIYPGCGRTCVELIERTIEAEDPETVAAVIVEPISISSAGFMVPPPDYLPRLREICDRHNVVLIYDEIITGFGRLGTMFGSQYFRRRPGHHLLRQGHERRLRAAGGDPDPRPHRRRLLWRGARTMSNSTMAIPMAAIRSPAPPAWRS